MNFAIITQIGHKKYKDNWYAYEPYIREMNLWTQHVSEVRIIAPVLGEESPQEIDSAYESENISLIKIPSINALSFINILLSIIKLPIISFRIIKVFFWADHIHLRCPGNIGLIGSVLQIFFPSKLKTAKYAGNWDPKSKQPLSYRIQKKILSNTFLTKNMKVLVYGKWKNQTKNILPFFTASYSENEIELIREKKIKGTINFIFVGTFSKGKQPLLSVKTIVELKKRGYNVFLNMYGDGKEFTKVRDYIVNNGVDDYIVLHGNVKKAEIKKAFQLSHFLIFISQSEGWPKVVAESMFWSCLPVSSNVSCVPYMLNNGLRGALVDENNIIEIIESYLKNDVLYQNQVENAREWSQKFTLEEFEKEIIKLL